MKYAAVIFDMDGTIVDTEKIWIEATKQFIINHGIEYTDAIHHELRKEIQGMATHETCQLIQQKFSLSTHLIDLINQKRAIVKELYKAKINYIDGFEHFFTTLIKEYTSSVAIATNADEHTIVTTDNALNLKRHFGNHIYGIERVANQAKPNPAIYLFAADQLGINPQLCVAIEDSAHGINAAKAAGMYCIGINSSGQRSQLVNADRIIESYNDLNIADLF